MFGILLAYKGGVLSDQKIYCLAFILNPVTDSHFTYIIRRIKDLIC